MLENKEKTISRNPTHPLPPSLGKRRGRLNDLDTPSLAKRGGWG
jgi:hypothetical protein